MIGSISQYTLTTDAFLVQKPKSLSHVEAASIPLVAMTAVQAFDKVNGGLEGKTVLVTGGRKSIRT
jgi:NADPH:quinone reductase-like Zn-dependent oxidoreductase